MATIIRIDDQYVNLDNVTSVSFISDTKVCIHLMDGTPQYISCYYDDRVELREILEALVDRTKRECENERKDMREL